MNRKKPARAFGMGAMQKLLSTVKWIRNDFLRFLLLTVIVLVSGSGGVAYAYGCWPGIVFLIAIMFFVLAALYIFSNSKREY
jgi:CHASE2 domain-containing sensor protein